MFLHFQFLIFIDLLFLQVMVFVHARNATVHTASKMQEIAKKMGESGMFQATSSPELGTAAKQVGLLCLFLDLRNYSPMI